MAIVSLSAAALASGSPATGTAGAALTAGEVVYTDTADSSKLKAAQNDTAAKCTAVGVMLNSCASGEVAIYAASGVTINTSGLTAGEVYVVSSTAGDLELVTDLASAELTTIVGVASSATALAININATGIAQP